MIDADNIPQEIPGQLALIDDEEEGAKVVDSKVLEEARQRASELTDNWKNTHGEV